MGRVTRISTCSGVSPTASVCMVTCGGANSGNTSSLASPSAYAPTATRMHASTMTMPRKRIEKRMIEACGPDGVVVLTNCPRRPEFLRQQQLRATGDDLDVRGHAGDDIAAVRRWHVSRNLDAHEPVRASALINPSPVLPPHDARRRYRDAIDELSGRQKG